MFVSWLIICIQNTNKLYLCVEFFVSGEIVVWIFDCLARTAGVVRCFFDFSLH